MRTFQAIDETLTYTLPDAARYVGMPPARTRRWVRALHTEGEQHLVSFTTLLELHVLKAFRLQEVPFQRVRRALTNLERLFPASHPLLERDFLTNGLDVFLEDAGGLVNLSRGGQLAWKAVVETFLKRIEWNQPGPRLYPFISSTSASDPKSVMIDPRFSFGRPVLTNTGISTAVIAGRFMARDSIADLAEEYRADPRQIEDVIRWELPHLNAA